MRTCLPQTTYLRVLVRQKIPMVFFIGPSLSLFRYYYNCCFFGLDGIIFLFQDERKDGIIANVGQIRHDLTKLIPTLSTVVQIKHLHKLGQCQGVFVIGHPQFPKNGVDGNGSSTRGSTRRACSTTTAGRCTRRGLLVAGVVGVAKCWIARVAGRCRAG